MAASWKLTVRAGSRVEHARYPTLDAAIDAAATELAALEPEARREPARAFTREVAPIAQVAARLELRGPGGLVGGPRGGIDLRGDGSSEAWTGRASKQVVVPERGETVVAALRRVLGGR
jgi:hypothetical protein